MLRERNCSVKPRSERSLVLVQTAAQRTLDGPLTLNKSEG